MINLPVPFSNPLAPVWMTAQYELCQRYQRYATTFTVPANSTLPNQQILLDNDSDFLWLELAFDQGIPSGIRFRDGDGKAMMRGFVDPRDIQGPLPIPHLLPYQSKFFCDLQNSTGADITVQVILQGIKQFSDTTGNTDRRLQSLDFTPLWARYSQPCDGWHDEKFNYTFQVSLAANGFVNHMNLVTDGDADFYWRGSSVDLHNSLGRLRWFFPDPWRNDLMQGPVTSNNFFGTAPALKPVYPEVIVPAEGYIQYSAFEYTGIGAVTADVKISGVKRFKD
jgi:hypothetical protein